MKKEKKAVEKKQKNKVKKDWNKILLISMIVLLVLEVVLIPCLVYAEVKKVLPIIAFLVIPTVFGIVILLLSRNCAIDFEKKKERLSKKRLS